VTPGDNELQGFIPTTILGIVGTFVATYLGQAIGCTARIRVRDSLEAVVGAVLILLVWGFVERGRRASFHKYALPLLSSLRRRVYSCCLKLAW